MKRLNAYYVISIVTLAFMFLILLRTLQAIGWFEDAPEIQSLAKIVEFAGNYSISSPGTDQPHQDLLLELNHDGDTNWMTVVFSDSPILNLKLSEFEEGQVLVEMFGVESSGVQSRMEGCELLLSLDETEQWLGSTLGDFCGYDETSGSYRSISFHGDKRGSSLIMETRRFDDQSLISKKDYYLERIDPHE